MNSYDLCHLEVMLVEKHGYMRRLLRDVLRQLGIRKVRDCDNVDVALEMFQENPADLVLTDWSPGLDGLELLKKLRQSDFSSNTFVPVVVITANTESRHIYGPGFRHDRISGQADYGHPGLYKNLFCN